MELAAVKAHCGGLRYILLSSFCQRLQNAPQIAITRVAMEHTLEGYAIVPLRRLSLRFDASLFGFVPLGRWNVQKLPVAYTAKALERYALRFVALQQNSGLLWAPQGFVAYPNDSYWKLACAVSLLATSTAPPATRLKEPSPCIFSRSLSFTSIHKWR